MAFRFDQRGYLQDPTGSLEPKEQSLTSPLYSSATWWEDREEQPDNGDMLKEQLKAMDDHVARLRELLKCERAKCSRLQLQCNQQGAELRRREQHLSRMKERLSLFTDRHKDRAPTIKILNTLPTSRGKREQPSGKKAEDVAVRVMLERREAELREAMKLRHSLASLLHALRCDMEQVTLGRGPAK